MLELRGISKSFGSVRALVDVDFDVRGGEVMALVGDNGAGKSTLIKCVAGIHPVDSGEILFDGRPVHIHGPKDAAVPRDRGRLPGPRTLRQPRRGPEHVPRPRAPRRLADAPRARDGGGDREDDGRTRSHDAQIRAPARRDAVGRSAPGCGRRAGGDVELTRPHPRRAHGGARRRPEHTGARPRRATRSPGPRGRHHLAQPAGRLRGRRPDHRAPAGAERGRLRASGDDAGSGRARDHARWPCQARPRQPDRTAAAR